MSTTTTPAHDTKFASHNGFHAARGLTILADEVDSLGKGIGLAGIDQEGWQAWQRHLESRKRIPPLSKLSGAAGIGALRWAMPEGLPDFPTGQLLDEIDAALRKRKPSGPAGMEELLRPWLAEAADGRRDIGFAYECLAWSHALVPLAGETSPGLWCAVAAFLVHTAEEAAAISLEKEPLLQQLLAGELPLTLACLLPEIDECRRLYKPARCALSEGLLELLDGEGLPHGKYLPLTGSLLACWTRAMLLGSGFKKGCFNKAAREQYSWLIKQSLRLARPGGGQMLAGPGAAAWRKPLWKAALDAGGDALDRKIAAVALPGHSRPAAGGRRLPEPGVHSEWAEVALLRTAWPPTAPRLLVNYSEGRNRIELCIDRHVVWSGACDPVIRVGGRTLAEGENWEEVCWYSDEDVDYLEIQTVLEEDWTIQRQMLLARDDLFLFVADAVLGPREVDLNYQCRWPLADAVRVEPERETTECALLAGKRRINVLPLALPEWRCDGRRAGTLRADENRLEYEIQRRGRRLYAPLLLDLHAARVKKELTWRQLTVGENLRPCLPDVAVAYRVQLGISQWLIYRSLAAQASRTVLGQNTFHEFICGRFDCEGEVDSLVEVE